MQPSSIHLRVLGMVLPYHFSLIAVVTFIICIAGVYIGRKFGTKLANYAGILGGSILLIIGLEIFITSFF